MGSRREEERNEKIIRGLMKLPPNRRCINCNSLGPQYVCTNFWTFVCMTCSGIHREFTHRVKSVSMSKFSSQEVEALQNGGNQRAREIYLKDWDQQRQRLPDNSNVDKVREFIKSVYVDKKYAGGKSADKPPRDLQSVRSLEHETRRASSYHSYSQSPPYDYQYEDRRYGKPVATLTRKPGSDRGLYVEKMSSYISSPNRLSERMFEDRFANEGSVSRFSDYSASSGGDPVRSGTASPNYQKDVGFNSPPIQPSRGNLSDVQKQTINLFPEARLQRERTASLGSVASFDSNSMSLKSFNSGSLVDVVSEPEQAVRAHQDDMSIFPQTSPSGPDILEISKAPVVPRSDSAATSQIDLFQLPGAPSTPSVDALHVPPLKQAPSTNAYELPQNSLSSSLDLFSEISQQQSLSDKIPMESSVTKNEGWATFDTSQTAASLAGNGNYTPLAGLALPAGVVSSTNIDQVSSSNVSMQWPPFQSSGAQASLSVSESWHGGLHDVHVPGNTAAQTWNAFDNSITSLSLESIKQSNEVQVAAYKPSSTADQYFGSTALEDSSKGEIQGAASHGGLSGAGGPSDYSMAPSYTPLVHPLTEEIQSQATIHRSTNPFDLPYESDLEPGNMFLDMSSLQAALPNSHLASTYLGSVTQPWFSQDPVTTFVPGTPQAGLGYMAGQAPNPQLGGIQAQEPVPSSVGGNPFA